MKWNNEIDFGKSYLKVLLSKAYSYKMMRFLFFLLLFKLLTQLEVTIKVNKLEIMAIKWRRKEENQSVKTNSHHAVKFPLSSIRYENFETQRRRQNKEKH